MMPQVYVFRSGDKWMIKTEGRVQGHFTDHAQALAAAIDIAENIGNTGREAEVLVTFKHKQLLVNNTPDSDRPQDRAAVRA
jgi:hypothetical protein